MNLIEDTAKWKFLNEPLYRWALWFVAMSAIGYAWKGVIDLME